LAGNQKQKKEKRKKSQNSFGITTWRTWPWFVAITSAWPSRLQAGSFVFLRRVGIYVERVHFRPRLAVSADHAFSLSYCHCLLVFARVCSCLLPPHCWMGWMGAVRLVAVGTGANRKLQYTTQVGPSLVDFHVPGVRGTALQTVDDGWTDTLGLDGSIGTCKVLAADLCVVAMSSEADHAAFVTESGKVFTWGCDFCGQLGREQTGIASPGLVRWLAHGGSPAVMVACGQYHTLVLTDNGSVYTTDAGSMYSATTFLGGSVPRGLFLVQGEGFTGAHIVMVAAGFYHNVALASGGEVFTWGDGGKGQLGHAHINWDFLDADDYVESEEGGYIGTHAPELIVSEAMQGSTAVQVAAGGTHTAIVTREGELWTFGFGDCGRLGHGDTLTKRVPTCVRSAPVHPFGASPVVSAACGATFTIALTKVGAVWTFGANTKGELGHDSCLCIVLPRQIEERHFGGNKIVSVSGGRTHAAAVTQQGALYMWGETDSEGRLYIHGGLPTLLASGALLKTRIGRFQELLPSHAVAFAMGTHPRLSGSTPSRTSRRSMCQKGKAPSTTDKDIPCVYASIPGELVQRIIEASGMAPAGFGNTQQHPGFTRMLGCI